MKIIIALLFCTLQCSWASYHRADSEAILKTKQEDVMAILDQYERNGFPEHNFFSKAKMSESEVSTIVDHHITNDTHVENQHIQFLNHMAHGFVDILEERTGKLVVNLNCLNFSAIAAKKYKQDWDHSKEFSSTHCQTEVNVALNYTVGHHDMRHISDCIAQGVLRMVKEPKIYLNQLFEGIKRIGLCPLDSTVPECEVNVSYSINNDLGNYEHLFQNASALDLVPLENIVAEKIMTIECSDAKLYPVRIEYDSFETCTAQENMEGNPFR